MVRVNVVGVYSLGLVDGVAWWCRNFMELLTNGSSPQFFFFRFLGLKIDLRSILRGMI